MTIDNKLLENLEKLSSLKIDDDQREEVIGQLNEIVLFVDNLNELDTTGYDTKFNLLGEAAHLREDEVVSSKEIGEDILKNAPRSEDNFFVVPAIIE